MPLSNAKLIISSDVSSETVGPKTAHVPSPTFDTRSPDFPKFL